jgi:L-ectoine synthase
MLVQTLDQLKAEGKQETEYGDTLRSVDLMYNDHGMGFTLYDVCCSAGFDEILWYKNHWEANYIIAGSGLLKDLSSGQTWPIEPGDIYVVGPQNRHRFRTDTELHAISIFNPPLPAEVTFDEDGSPGPTGDVPPGPGGIVVKRLNDLCARGHEMVVAGGNARSIRALLQEDQLGFTLCDVRMNAGNRSNLWYKHHVEANVILQGHGLLSDLDSGESWPLEAGTMYFVGPDDRHSVAASSDLHLLSIFNPALQGDEQHDEEGTLPSTGPLPAGPHKTA